MIWGSLAPKRVPIHDKTQKAHPTLLHHRRHLLSTPLFNHLAQCLPTDARCHGHHGQYVHPLAPPSPFSVQTINTAACTHIFSIALHTCFLKVLSSLNYPVQASSVAQMTAHSPLPSHLPSGKAKTRRPKGFFRDSRKTDQKPAVLAYKGASKLSINIAWKSWTRYGLMASHCTSR